MIQSFLRWCLFICILALPQAPVFASSEPSEGAKSEMMQFTGGPEFWKQIRDGERGRTTAFGQESNDLINVEGMYWEQWRNDWVGPIPRTCAAWYTRHHCALLCFRR